MLKIDENIKDNFRKSLMDVEPRTIHILESLLVNLPISHDHHTYHTNGILISFNPTIRDGVVGDTITGVVSIYSVMKYNFVISLKDELLVKWSKTNVIQYYSKHIARLIFDE